MKQKLMERNCTVCGKLFTKYNASIWINYSFSLLADEICTDCFCWMDKCMQQHKAMKYRPYYRGLYLQYCDRSPREISTGKDLQDMLPCYPVYLP